MNYLKKSLLIFIMAFTAHSAHSQISVGGNISFLKFFGGNSELSTTGLTVRGDYALRDDLGVTGGFSYYFANTRETEYSLRPFNSSDNYLTVSGEDKYNFMHFYIGMKKYFIGEYDAGFGLYGELDLGLLLSPFKSDINDFDSDKYYDVDLTDETFSNFMIGFGLGLEKELGFGYIFGEAKFNLPSNQENGEAVAIEIPGNSMLNLGVRIPMD